MPTLIENLKKNYKTILIVISCIIMLPIINLIIEMIFTYGQYIGTFIRNIVENGACF
ncbi:MAG: hypothetical protein RRY22_01910 [Bacilli bacterium]